MTKARASINRIEVWLENDEPRCSPVTVENAIPIVRQYLNSGGSDSTETAHEWITAVDRYQELYRKRSTKEEKRIDALMKTFKLDRAEAIKFITEYLGL